MPSEIGTAQRIIVTVRPGAGHDGRLRVDDALLQIIDFLRLADEAKLALGRSDQDFEWLLDSASTNSPFTLVAVARPIDPTVDISMSVREVKRETAAAMSKFISGDQVPGWVTPEGYSSIHSIVMRTANGIDATNFDFDQEAESLNISHSIAVQVLPNLAEQVHIAASDIPARTAHGEVSGVLGSVGRWRGKPALYLMTVLYGGVWCLLPPSLIEQWGDETRLSSVWRGRRLTVYGRLVYWRGGKLSRIEAENVRERDAQAVDIRQLLDPEFTSGLDPVEYLQRLHEGRIG